MKRGHAFCHRHWYSQCLQLSHKLSRFLSSIVRVKHSSNQDWIHITWVTTHYQCKHPWFMSYRCCHHNDVIMSPMASQITGGVDGLLNRLFRRRSKKTSKLRVTGLCEGNSPATGEFPTQRASHAENVSIRWRHHVTNKIHVSKYNSYHHLFPAYSIAMS